MDGLLDLSSVLVIVSSIHLWYSPFTKVEESFTLQAIHDILKYGIFDISKYDHLEFPGVVPRSFVGPLIISALAYPFNLTLSNDPMRTQMLVRFVIGLTNTIALNRFVSAAKETINKRDAEEKKQGFLLKGSDVATWFGLFTVCQFHIMYYLSRPLPNFVMALPLSLLGLAWALEEKYKWSLILLSFTAVVFRLEIAALSIGVAIGCLLYKKLPIISIFRTCFIGIATGAFLSYHVDSYFWKRYTIPELEAFYFNVIQGQSAKWGTEPFFSYFTGYLPMMFMPPTALILNQLGLRIAPQSFTIVGIAAYVHVLIMSMQPHKEWRFIIYANPPITLLGATAAAYLFTNLENKTVKGVAVRFALLLTPVISGAISIAFSYISSMNYPGGYALLDFNQMVKANNITDVTIHLDIPVCMTGASLFGELNAVYNITYDRTEGKALSTKWNSFDYVITPQTNTTYIPIEDGNEWELVSKAQAFGGIDTDYLLKVFTEQYAHGLDLFFTWEQTGNLDFLYEIFNHSIIMDDVFFTYKKVPLL